MRQYSSDIYYEDIDTGRIYRTAKYPDGQVDVYEVIFTKGEIKEVRCNPRDTHVFLTEVIDNTSILADREVEALRAKSEGKAKPYWEYQE